MPRLQLHRRVPSLGIRRIEINPPSVVAYMGVISAVLVFFFSYVVILFNLVVTFRMRLLRHFRLRVPHFFDYEYLMYEYATSNFSLAGDHTFRTRHYHYYITFLEYGVSYWL